MIRQLISKGLLQEEPDESGFTHGLGGELTDSAEFERRLHQCQRLVYGIAFGVLRDTADAEEVTQEVFLKAHRKLSSLRHGSKFRAWVARMSWRLALNRQRALFRARRRDASWWQVTNPGSEDAEQIAAERELYRRLLLEIDRLPEKLRAVVLMNGVEELETSEIAAALRIPEGTVRSRLHLARKRLLQVFSDERM